MEDSIYYIIFLTLTILLFFIGLITIIKISVHNYEKKNNIYDILEETQKGNKPNQNMLRCPNGCVRGRCDVGKNGCKYDYQCTFCKDTLTKLFYTDQNNILEKKMR